MVQAAFRLPWSYRDELFRLGIVPVLLSFAIEMIGTLLGNDTPVVLLADMVPMTMFHVAVYRLLLLGPDAVTPGIKPSWAAASSATSASPDYRLAVVVIVLVMLLLLATQASPMVRSSWCAGRALLTSYATAGWTVAFPRSPSTTRCGSSEAARCTGR